LRGIRSQNCRLIPAQSDYRRRMSIFARSSLLRSISTSLISKILYGWKRLAAHQFTCAYNFSTRGGLITGLIHRAPAGFAQACLVPLQADCNSAYIRNFAGTEAIDVRRAGPALLGRAKRKGGTARNKRQSESQYCCNIPRAERRERLCDHGDTPPVFAGASTAPVPISRYAKAFLPNVIFLTLREGNHPLKLKRSANQARLDQRIDKI